MAELARPLRNPLVLFGGAVIAALFLVAALAPVLAPYGPQAGSLLDRFQAPGPRHWFGTDSSGFDVFSRVLYGARPAIGSGLIVLAISTSVGTAVGLAAGYGAGAWGEVLLRTTDVFLAFPGLLLAMAVVAAVQQRTLWAIVVAISIRWWAPYARIVTAQTLSIREREYVEAARSIGARHLRVLVSHILPNALSPIIVQATLDLGAIILTTAALSFIGFGAEPGAPDWGRMVADGRQYMRDQWWVVLFPGLAIFFAVAAFNLAGDGARDAFDPRLRSE
ncbi:MAG TPA: ABC transporter permease [bacterium]|nr:ABC transporter permease [bacterium]